MTVSPPGAAPPLARTAILLGLVLLAVTAVRGRLPDTGPADSAGAAQSSPVTLAGVLILLSASMLITAVALLTSPPRPARPAPAQERRFPGGSGVWSLRRLLLLAVGFALVVLLAVLLRAQLPGIAVPRAPDSPRLAPPPAGGRAPAGGAGPPVNADDDVFGYLALSVAAMAVLMAVSAVIARRRRGAPPPAGAPEPGAPGGPDALVAAAQRGLAAVEDLSRSPREAIIACYAAMEKALAGAPGAAPLDSDTPSEVLARAVANRALRADSAGPLVEVFAEARFSTHTMTERHREVAEHGLRAVLDELRGRP